MRRVLLVCPSWGQPCGIASYTARLKAGLEAGGVRVNVARDGPEVRRRLRGSKVTTTKGYLGVILQFEYALYRHGLRRLVEELEESGLPVAVTLHSVNSGDGHKKANRLLLGLPATFVTHSEEARMELRRARRRLGGKWRRGRTAVVPVGCPDPAPEPKPAAEPGYAPCTRREMGLGEDEFVVGFFGFAAAHKGVPNLVRALATLPDVRGFIAATAHPRNPKAVEAIHEEIDRGRNAAEPAATAAGGNVIMVHERIPDEDFLRCQNAVDVIVLPYTVRGATISSSMVACEALAGRRPVIVTDVPYFSGLGDAVYRIPDSEPETIAAAITTLRRDAALRQALVERALRYAEEHSWPKVARRYLKLLGDRANSRSCTSKVVAEAPSKPRFKGEVAAMMGMTGQHPSVEVHRKGKVLTVIINRPEAKNAVDGPTARRLAEVFREFDGDASSCVAVLAGAGGTFCAGADLKALARAFATGDLAVANPLDEDLSKEGPMGPTRLLLTKPVIAAVSGYAVGGGFELALWCDLRVVERNAVFGAFDRRFGVPLIDGGTWRLPQLVGVGRALDLILSGRPVGADEALAIGLANRVVEPGTAREAAEKLAAELAELPQTCLRSDREAVYRCFGLAPEEALGLEFALGSRVIQSGETAEGALRFAGGAGRHGDKLRKSGAIPGRATRDRR